MNLSVPQTLIIVMAEDGGLSVSGPVADKALCYAMLEMARDAIRDFKPPENVIELARAGSLPPRPAA